MTEKKVLIKEETFEEPITTLKDIYDKYNKEVMTADAYRYIEAYSLKKTKIAAAVACFISSVIFPTLGSMIDIDLLENLSVILMFVMVAVGVLLIKNANEVFRETVDDVPYLTNATYDYLRDELFRFKKQASKLRTIGIILCCFSFVPIMILEPLYLDELGVALFFLMIAVGVFMIMYSCHKTSAYNKLLK